MLCKINGHHKKSAIVLQPPADNRTKSIKSVFPPLQAGVLLAAHNDRPGRKNGGGRHHSLSRGQTSLQRTGVFQRTESDAGQRPNDRQVLSGSGRPHR